MDRKDFARQYLYQLILRWEELEAERQQLLAAATRITAIQAEKADLLTDAQDALAKYNQVFGTSYTLPQVKAWYDASSRMILKPPPVAVVPVVTGLTQAAAEAALVAVKLIPSVSLANNDEVAEGLVISQSPAAGVNAALQTMVFLVVSQGPLVTP